ncbi:uncharacterized protein LOC101940050 isoform X6 [Chrysemys picta bellii]|uniref:uncharacterized protein LOC101940050 isoform X6 n=1 Tax=Chrysemys picta bellii TaxID=8478 RepID=UPI0032B1EE0D
MKCFEVKAKTPVLLSQTNQASYSATKGVNDFTCNRRQRTLYFHGSRKNLTLTSRPSWQPCLSSQENVFKKCMLKNSAVCKVVPYYTTFVSGATLWDRGIYHPAHNRHHERPSLLCPRFTAHMKISPGILESPQMLSTKFRGFPVKQMSQNKKNFPTQRNTWRDSACSDTTCEVRSQTSKLSNGTQDAFNELEGINPQTDCSLSQHDEGDSSEEDLSDLSELSKRAESLNIGCVSEDESLAEIRLSLLDHQSWEKTGQHEGIQNDVEEWCNASEDILEYKMKNIGSAALDANGFLLHLAPAFLKENKTSDTYSNNGIADQQSIYTMTVGMKSPNTLRNEENSFSTTELHPNTDLEIKSSIAGASLVEDCCLFPQLTGLNETESTLESRDPLSVGHMNRAQFDTVLKELAEESNKDMDGCCIGDKRPGESRTPSHANRGRPSKLDHTILLGMDQQRKAEGRQAQALYIYSKLQETQIPAFRAPETRTISNFEDFDFLAKYCIFSQEKLAKYKMAFEAVDTDGDGYLNCLQVLMALKETVPSDALTDAEELYVYRILEIVDYYVTDGLTDLRLFAVMASLAQKITALDNFMRALIGLMDFKALELKMYNARPRRHSTGIMEPAQITVAIMSTMNTTRIVLEYMQSQNMPKQNQARRRLQRGDESDEEIDMDIDLSQSTGPSNVQIMVLLGEVHGVER